MKRADRDAWVADLRAHPELQGHYYLSCNNKNCCLGRLAILHGCRIISGEDRVQEDYLFPADEDLVEFPEHAKFDRMGVGFPPRYWLISIGLSYAQAEHLASLNDSGRSFAKIADWIEQNVPVED